MKLFISGGGDGLKTKKVNEKLNKIINHDKPILYIPLAMDENKHSYNDCFEWIQEELKMVNVPFIDMVRSIDELEVKNYHDYSALFIGGGNTFSLLKLLKESKCFDKLKQYIFEDGIVFGGSAGAIILGQSINVCKFADENSVKLDDLTGLNVLNYFSLLCHFTNQTEEKTEITKNYLIELSKKQKILALPEEDTLYIENGKYEIIGNKPFYVFDSGNMIEYNFASKNIDEYYMLKTYSQLMDFMDSNITYGWIDYLNNLHLNNLISFRKNYRISAINEILEFGVGTCIEQAKLEKNFFDRIGIENKLFCHRGYESEENINEEVKMHCFLLFKFNDIWYHFEHSNRPKRGVHPYGDLSEALNDICSGFEKNDIRILTEISNIPEGLSFKEFNEYVNEFDLKQKKF